MAPIGKDVCLPEIQTPTHDNPLGRSMTARPLACVNPSTIFPSYFAFISSSKVSLQL